MKKKATKSVPASEPTAPAEQPSNPTQTSPNGTTVSGSRTEHFLMVEIPRGASREQLVEAVTKALESSDVPLFRNRNLASREEYEAERAKEPLPAEPSSRLGEKFGPDDALLMFCKQEGWPNP